MKKHLILINKNRYKEFKGYKFDRWLTTIFMILIFGFLFFVAYHYDFNLDYYQCGANFGETCTNPFYKELSWKNQPTLSPGEYGQKPGLLFKSVIPVSLIGLFLLLLSNHLIHNRKVKLSKFFNLKEGEKENETININEFEHYR